MKWFSERVSKMTSRYEEVLLPEQRDRIIEKVINALKAKGQLSTKTLNRFRRILKAGRPISGFNNDPISAPPPLLKQNMTERLEYTPEFAYLVSEVWAETEPQLRDAVGEHLDSLDPQIYEGDEMEDELWDAQISLLADKHGDYEEDDILLMTKVCYTHAKMEAKIIAGADADSRNTEGEPIEDATDDIPRVLSGALASLRMLSAESAAWNEEIPQFAEAMNNLVSDKIEERNQLRSRMLLDDIDELDRFFIPDLEFFGRYAADWNLNSLTTSGHLPEAARLVSDLKTELQTYRGIKESADTLAEERERREQRHDLEDAIEQMLTKHGLAPAQLELSISERVVGDICGKLIACLLYTSPSPRDGLLSRMPSSA